MHLVSAERVKRKVTDHGHMWVSSARDTGILLVWKQSKAIFLGLMVFEALSG